MTEKKKTLKEMSKSERSAMGRKGAKASPWGRWNPGAFSSDPKKRKWRLGEDK
jgi:hypothetical protein